MTEEWKAIEGYEGIYEVSSFGRVRSLDRYYIATHSRAIGVPVRYFKKGRILKATLNKKTGYLYVQLKTEGQKETRPVHRLVGRAFVAGYFDGADINHKNEIKTDNRADNLEWCTRQYNLDYNDLRLRSGVKRKKSVAQLSADGRLIATFPSITDASKATGIPATHICACCRTDNRRKVAGGFIWKYINQDNGET